MSRGETSIGMSPGRAEEWARGFVRVCVVGATLKDSVTFAMPENPRLGKENTRDSIVCGVGMLWGAWLANIDTGMRGIQFAGITSPTGRWVPQVRLHG